MGVWTLQNSLHMPKLKQKVLAPIALEMDLRAPFYSAQPCVQRDCVHDGSIGIRASARAML